MEQTLPLRKRVSVSAAIGLAGGLLCWYYGLHIHIQSGAGDFTWILHAAEDLLAGRDPYSNRSLGAPFYYPLPAAFVGLPLVWLPYRLAAAVFFGGSSALLAFGLSRHGYTRLLVFLCAPYWVALLAIQWSPLLTSIALFPALVPLVLAKPHTAAPVALLNLTRRGVLLTIAVGLLSLAISPSWPLRWLANLGEHQNFIPLLTAPGLLLLLALGRYRDRDVWLLLLQGLVPQRAFYDQLNLWLIPQTARTLMITALISWIGYWGWFLFPAQGAGWTMLCCYLPMLMVLVQRGTPAFAQLQRAIRSRLAGSKQAAHAEQRGLPDLTVTPGAGEVHDRR